MSAAVCLPNTITGNAPRNCHRCSTAKPRPLHAGLGAICFDRAGSISQISKPVSPTNSGKHSFHHWISCFCSGLACRSTALGAEGVHLWQADGRSPERSSKLSVHRPCPWDQTAEFGRVFDSAGQKMPLVSRKAHLASTVHTIIHLEKISFTRCMVSLFMGC